MGHEKKVVNLPRWLVKFALLFVQLKNIFQGKEGGLSPLALADLQTRNCFFDPKIAQVALHIHGGGLDEAFKETLEAC